LHNDGFPPGVALVAKNRAKEGIWTEPAAFTPQYMPLQHVPMPAGHEIHLWYLHLGQLGGSLHHALAGEDGAEDPAMLRPEQLRFIRRFYLRLLLGSYLGIAGKDVVINRSNRGKPVLDRSVHRSELKFSMAKSEDRLLIGVSAFHPVGVDLEPAWRQARNALRLAERYFSPAEFRQLASIDSARLNEAFLRAWALNEAVVKASGLGIANQLCRFTLGMDPDQPPVMLAIDGDQAAEWSLALVRPSSDFIGAVASRQPGFAMTCFRLLPAT
jgi:4'-phosphopantetheinyl transferase